MLSDLDKSFIQRFVEEDDMVEAIKKFIIIEAFNMTPEANPNETDEVLGQRVRAFQSAKELISKSFDNMAKYKGRGKINNINNLER